MPLRFMALLCTIVIRVTATDALAIISLVGVGQRTNERDTGMRGVRLCFVFGHGKRDAGGIRCHCIGKWIFSQFSMPSIF